MMKLSDYRFYRIIFLLLACIIIDPLAAQGSIQDSARTIVSGSLTERLQTDSIKILEIAPLDIGENRGLFIAAPDRKMQLRIFGSVRFLVVFDNHDLKVKNAFNTYEIPTGAANNYLPNYYNGLDQTRLGFDIIRRTPKGDVFIRLETDFAGPKGFRIRHAYGQYRNFLFGQSWSLFSQITALPEIVTFTGPTGGVAQRTPQIRYSANKPVLGMNFQMGLEYVVPDLRLPDSLLLHTFQLIPDITLRVDKKFDRAYFQLSLVIPALSARDNNNDLLFKTGWGIAGSVVLDSWENGRWYIMGVGGKSIARYINDIGGNGLEVTISSSGKALTPFTYGGYLTYQQQWTKSVYSNLTYGFTGIEKFSFTPDNAFNFGNTIRLNTFWNAVEGAKLGVEGIWGRRTDNRGSEGDAFRINLLCYYDF